MNRHTLATPPQKHRRSSAVSQILKAITDTAPKQPQFWEVLNSEGDSSLRVRVASDAETRRKAYALAYRVYSRSGYTSGNTSGLCVSAYDGFAGTITLLAEDTQGREAGTISLVFDSNLGLPCHEIYRDEVEAVRRQGCRIVEVTRLAIDDDVPNARGLLLQLFSLSYIFAKYVGGCTDMLIEINPRHVEYYRRCLRFEQVGPERPCPRVNGAPAVLMKMDFSVIEQAVQGHTAGRDACGRRLHPYPFTQEEEQRAAKFLSHHHRTMTFSELRLFNIVCAGAETAGSRA